MTASDNNPLETGGSHHRHAWKRHGRKLKTLVRDVETRKGIARTIARRLALLAVLLAAVFLLINFRVGEKWWPPWLSTHPGRVEALLALAIVVVVCFSPIVVEVTSNPHAHIYGPGEDPRAKPWS